MACYTMASQAKTAQNLDKNVCDNLQIIQVT